MWGAFARQIFAYLLTRRGKRALAFVGMLSLCFVTALLADMQLYISATFTGGLSVVLVMMWLVQYWRVKQHDRLREKQRLEAAARRLAAAQEREQRYDRAKARMADTVRAAGATVSDNTIGVARSGFDAARAGVASTVSAAKNGVASTVSATKNGVAATVSTAKDGVASTVSAAKNGVAAAGSGVAAAASGVTSGVASGVRAGLGATKSGIAATSAGVSRAADGMRFWRRRGETGGEPV